ncbi:excalibur calcium-binding domain-containing protein [Streptomyces marokkonensis]|uniref:Excalibur calcium-binding domain-containing protein n=1 Tax=Streptomyces marokkonensis TaxID=324855 RepID=A0ABP7PZ76_9ACTN
MNLLRKPVAVAVAALALAALPTAAQAHEGTHPFDNCTEAYENGYSNIKKDDKHYAEDLDRDKDGVGCDKPPAGFVPAGDKDEKDAAEKDDDGAGSGNAENSGSGEAGGSKEAAGQQGADLAETGGDDTTPYIAAGGAAVVLAGGGLLLAVNRRRATR